MNLSNRYGQYTNLNNICTHTKNNQGILAGYKFIETG